ncbi:MAG: phage holin family protein [Ruminococcus sp.]|nr:phage holin family protein [Ruminococcus sp.]
MKEWFCAMVGTVGGLIAGLFGGWDAAMLSLLIFMGIDYITGLIVAASGKSLKSDNGGLSSKIGWRGLAKKCIILLLVLVAARLDIVLGTDYVRAGVCIGFMCNEVISILENAGLMGIRLPDVLTKAIDLLQKKDK